MAQPSLLEKKRRLPYALVPITKRVNERLSVRLYRDARPNCLEVSSLHKGLVLLLDDVELIEEGMGFGVPVVKYADKTLFSTSAECSLQEAPDGLVLCKRFVLDTISRKRLWKTAYIDDDLYGFFRKLFEKPYLRYKMLFPVFDKLMELRQVLFDTDFVRVTPRGIVDVRYCVTPSVVRVDVDLSNLEKVGCREVLLLNEQGSTYFRAYSDTNGLRLFDAEIGAWNVVSADEASFSFANGFLRFTLSSQSNSMLFRGWEKTRNRFSWAGLAYSLSPKTSAFHYSIKLSLVKDYLHKTEK